MEPTADSHRTSATRELGSDDKLDEAVFDKKLKTPRLNAENKQRIREDLICVLFEQVDTDLTFHAYARLRATCGSAALALFADNKAVLVRNLERGKASKSSRIVNELYHTTAAFPEKSNNDLLALKYLVLLGYLCISTKDRDGYDATISQIRELVSSNAANAL
ncbi:hypothetical protein AAVH_27129 [Aphelenchoides avenae]|nr:hypothetical protein AAVH_27129 [Aphelenchus avenae]